MGNKIHYTVLLSGFQQLMFSLRLGVIQHVTTLKVYLATDSICFLCVMAGSFQSNLTANILPVPGKKLKNEANQLR